MPKNISDKKYWEKFYRKAKIQKESSFARFALPMIVGNVIDLGAGNGRDMAFFHKHNKIGFGVDEAYEGNYVYKCSVSEFINKFPSPQFVYTRFFWHAISREEQLAILDWTYDTILIEARTTEDRNTKKVYGNHRRNYVDVAILVKDLKDKNFEIIWFTEGSNLSPYKGENPHLVRVVARKKVL